ncbi:MAG TPA: methyltransferase domain-containing protein [Ktedonobacteraceae bacterium]
MSTSPDPRNEHPSTYVVQDRSNEEELMRLQKQDQWVTSMMGGVLAEQADPTTLSRVLDIGCGTGGWLLETARLYPQISLLSGVDVSKRMIQFARSQAEAQQLDQRVEFQVMDALRMLEFPTNHFDLVNARSSSGYLRTWDWLKFLQECRRVSRPKGIVRISEGNMTPHSTSPALTRLFGLALEALYRAGHFFTPEGDSVQQKLPGLLERFGFQNVQTRTYQAVTRAGTEEWQLACDDMRLLFRTILPFLQKWLQVPDDYQEIYQQMLSEMQQPDFASTTLMVTVWGKTPFERN